MQEEPGETLGGASKRGSMWLCPLCQESQPDRENLSHHLTDKHSVLPACLDKLLDIAAPKHSSIAEDEESKAQNDADETSQQKHLENTKSPSMASQNESEPTDAGDKGGSSQEKELDEELEAGRNEESDMGGLESDQDNVEQTVKTSEASISNGRSVCKNNVASEGDNRPFKCNACLESFPTRTALSVHYNSTTHIQRMRTGTVKDSDSTPFLARPYVSNKPYQCAVCRVSYNHAITLESHLKSVLHQSRSRSAGNATPSSTANTGTGTMVTNLAATTVGSTTQLVNASTSNCVTQANLTPSAVTTKDGEQVQPQLAPSLLSSPVASAQAMSAILTLLTSSPNSLPHSILPPLFTTGTSATPGAATPQLIPQPQMLMPLVLNGLQTQTQIQGQNPESPNQLLQQAVPVLGLSAAQQALLAQRLSGLQSQWAAFGLPTTTQMSIEETNKTADKGADLRVHNEIKVEPCNQQMSLKSEEDWKIDGLKKEICIKVEKTQEQSEKIVDDGTTRDEKEQEESEMEIERTSEKVCQGDDANSKVTESSVASVLRRDSSLSCVMDPNQGLSHTHPVNSSGAVNCTFRNTNFALRASGHRSAKAHPLLSSGRSVLTEFQSQVLWAFLESRDDAETSSPQREDCEALGREVGLSGEEVRKWFLDARQSKDRERLDSFHDELDRSMEEEEGNLMIDEGEDEHSPSATGSHAIDLSSNAERHRIGKGSPRELLLTSDSENEEFYTSVIVTDEESQSSSMREESGSPIKQSSQVEPTAERSSGGGKVLRSTTVFLSDAEDEYDDEQSMKRKKRKSEIDKEEVEIKREKQDVDLDLQLEAQADPPTPLSVAVDHQGVPTGILQSLPLSLSLAPLSTQLYSPYVLSLPSSVIGVGVSEGDRGKMTFSNTQAVTRSPGSAPATTSLTHSFLSNGNDCESALDLSMGKNHSSTISSTSSVSLANKSSIQKSHLLDGLGLRPATVGVPTDGGLIVVQVKPDPAIASNNSTLTNRNNLAKTSTVYMRAAEKVSTSLMEREKEKEREKEREQKRPKVRRFRDMRRSRTIIHADQLDILYGCYFKDPNPGKHEFEQISEWVNLPKKVVQIWFQNMRARERKGEVRFISDGTLAAVGKPLIKFTWPLSKPIFSTPPKPNPSPSTGWVSAKPQTGNVPPKTDKVKEVKEPPKIPIQGPSRPNQTGSFTVVSTSPSLVHKTKTEATPITMVKIAPKTVATPVAVPLIVSGIPTSRSAPKRKVEEVQAESDRTDDDDDDYRGGVESGTTSHMVPKLSPTPINKSSALATQKHNGLKYWSQKGPFKINTLSREQLGLSSQRPTPTTTTPTTPSPVTVTASSGQNQKETSYMLQNSTPRRPRTHLNCLQLSILQSCYETCAHPNALECEAVGTELGLPLKVVQIWFQNTRAKEKRWRLQQEKMSPNPIDPSKKVDVSSGSYLQYNALRANRPILPKPVQLTVVEPTPTYTIGQTTGRETLRGKCDACGVEFESRAAARDHVFSARHLATLRTTNFGQQASLVSNGSGTGSTGFASQSSTPSPASSSS
ncbi:zinc finger homeobox protein 3 isoform X1 [Megalobrama amblycephala]|uniref:zinc finger homeobox protein 3 isoform X1 n=2 Tax=Megalobrama amblycephala TaxID=75352 RepID=UPI0020143650|nr:zinc finger homeobox protein 3 isoform X1 [Megalobrama amblycephala]